MDSVLALLRRAGPGFCVLTGAGCSTSAGIPDYRDEGGRWKRGTAPVLYQDFVANPDVRRRYWARSCIGWDYLRGTEPSPTHRGIAELEAADLLSGVITQNVDGLHRRAGSQALIELHGGLDGVVCLRCDAVLPRSQLQRELVARNPAWSGRSAAPGPDGDALLEAFDHRNFRVPECRCCGGILKPAVVFFGESVPPDRVRSCHEIVGNSTALLVIGTSLGALSALRIVREAHRRGTPIAAINLGRTRGDQLYSAKVTAACDAVVPQIKRALDTNYASARSRGRARAVTQPLF
jgi:NAD-dependent SIR2 family protein deacetylase